MITGFRPATFKKADNGMIICYSEHNIIEASWRPETMNSFTKEAWLWQHMSDSSLDVFIFPTYVEAVQARQLWNKCDKIGPKLAAAVVQTVAELGGIPDDYTAEQLAKQIKGLGPARAKAVLPFLVKPVSGLYSEAIVTLTAMGFSNAAEAMKYITASDVEAATSSAELVELALARRRV